MTEETKKLAWALPPEYPPDYLNVESLDMEAQGIAHRVGQGLFDLGSSMRTTRQARCPCRHQALQQALTPACQVLLR